MTQLNDKTSYTVYEDGIVTVRQEDPAGDKNYVDLKLSDLESITADLRQAMIDAEEDDA